MERCQLGMLTEPGCLGLWLEVSHVRVACSLDWPYSVLNRSRGQTECKPSPPINHIVSINNLGWPRPQVDEDTLYCWRLSIYLTGSVLSLECAAMKRPRPTELTLYSQAEISITGKWRGNDMTMGRPAEGGDPRTDPCFACFIFFRCSVVAEFWSCISSVLSC